MPMSTAGAGSDHPWRLTPASTCQYPLMMSPTGGQGGAYPLREARVGV